MAFLGDFVKNAVYTSATFENDTEYPAFFIDYVGVHPLNPGEKTESWMVTKAFSVDLRIVFPNDREVKKNFPGSEFENRTHKLSVIFKEEIYENEAERKAAELCTVRDADSGANIGVSKITASKMFDLLKGKSAHWDDIGRAFRIPFNAQESLRRDGSLTDDARLEKILNRWLEITPPSDVTWSAFMTILTDSLRYNDVARQTQKFLRIDD